MDKIIEKLELGVKQIIPSSKEKNIEKQSHFKIDKELYKLIKDVYYKGLGHISSENESIANQFVKIETKNLVYIIKLVGDYVKVMKIPNGRLPSAGGVEFAKISNI